jgi:hypothetical protein
MAAGDRTALRLAARAELADPGTLWSDAELNRTIDEITADISRLMPRERVLEVTLDLTITNEAFTSNGAHATAEALDTKPIKPKSETVTNSGGTTTYTRDTDYIMDYVNGTLATISGGGMGLSTGFLVDYTKSTIAIDISATTDIVNIIRVEVEQDLPQEFKDFYRWGDWLYVGAAQGRNQEAMANQDHLSVYYHATHTASTDSVAATYPRFLDEVAVKGMVAYALFIKSRQRNLRSVSDVNAARIAMAGVVALHVYMATDFASMGTVHSNIGTSLGNLSSLHTSIRDLHAHSSKTDIEVYTANVVSALGNIAALHTSISSIHNRLGVLHSNIATRINESGTDLDTVETDIKAATKSILDALDNASSEIALANSQVDLANTATDDADAAGTGPIDLADTQLDTVDGTLLAKINTALDKVTTHGGASTNSMVEALDAAVAVWTEEVKHILTASGIPNAEDFLELGDGTIPTVNIGSDVPALYARYSSEARQLAELWDSKRKDYISEAQGWYSLIQAFTAEANGRVGDAQIRINHASAWHDNAEVRMKLADRYLGAASGYLGTAAQHISVAEGRWTQIQGFLRASSGRLEIAQHLINEISNYMLEVSAYQGQIDRHIAEAQVNINGINTFLAQIGMYLGQMDRHVGEANVNLGELAAYSSQQSQRNLEIQGFLNEAQLYLSGGQQEQLLADRFLADARDRHTDYWRVLLDRVQQGRRRSMTSLKQYSDSSGRHLSPTGDE